LPVQVISFKFKENDFVEIEGWLKQRFAEISEAEKLPDNKLPICTPDDRFNSGDKFAVMKKGRKTAMRVLDSEEEAEKLNTGMVVFDVNKSELVNDVSDNVQPLGD